jgi:hypothetical protein
MYESAMLSKSPDHLCLIVQSKLALDEPRRTEELWKLRTTRMSGEEEFYQTQVARDGLHKLVNLTTAVP